MKDILEARALYIVGEGQIVRGIGCCPGYLRVSDVQRVLLGALVAYTHRIARFDKMRIPKDFV